MKNLIILLILIISFTAYAGIYDISQDFLNNKMYEDAKRETIQIMYSGKEDIKAEGYFLLGKIDAVKGDYESARANWIKLKELYPKSDFTKSAIEQAAFINISLNREAVKDIFEIYSVKMGMNERNFQDAKDDMKARLNKSGIPVVKINGEFLSGELFKLDMSFENFISFDSLKTLSALAKIEALRGYLEGRINSSNYNVVSSKSIDGRVYKIIITDRKIYAKKYQPELEKGIELLKTVEKEKIVPVKGVVDEEVLKAIEDEEREKALLEGTE